MMDGFLPELPFVSILVPIRNEDDYIVGCLESIFQQEYPKEKMEVIIADGMSTDRTREMVQKYRNCIPPLYLIDNFGKIVPMGMNLALPKTKGTIIIRVDGHCVISPNYVYNCVIHLLKDDIDGVGGPMQTIGETPLSETIALAMSSKFGVGGSVFRTMEGKTILADTVPFPAYTRRMVEKAGLYDEELVRNQDDEYNYRIRELGGRILLADDVRSKYFSRGSLGKLWKQYYQYGFYKVRVLQKHPRQMSLRQFVPPVFVASLVLSLFITALLPWGWIPFLLFGGSYLFANLTASLITASKKGWRHLALLPFTFAILHLSYGFGFLAGLIRFWNRWRDKIGKVPEWNFTH